ncbi:DEAD-box ATP-dependent RNA helicase 28-like [Prunus yedoensis var. nudiflora]|uniref:DEAD-box ATP-dependent RNA helicase 28-like n=1 Tax=Prunus yedoensis var. nudiflora TaxID=2094558 RepID=A0A314YGD4_PRUYE|nr:DEAD-box ATP-dependent RNA helicase 28-like [Prunus yedoensis var. nudiflora]
MTPSFVFEPPSDEEYSKEEQGLGDGNFQSSWDFASYSKIVSQEYARGSTTSIDFKIAKAVQQQQISHHNAVDEGEGGSSLEYESNKQESDKEGDQDEGDNDDNDPLNGNNNKPLLRACDKLDHTKPTLIESGDEEEGNVDSPNIADGNNQPFFAPSEGMSFHANSFMELNLSRPLLRACEKLGHTMPTPIQAACIPLACAGRDICGSAITGSGKTAAFALPTLERLLFRPKRMPAIRVLILTPTRELGLQVLSMIEKLAQFTDIRCCQAVGGLALKAQEAALRSKPDIVVATPGRIIDHLHNSMSVDFEDLAVLILDEADRLLEDGFSAEIRELIRLCPKRRQTMLFSATMTTEVDELVKLSLTKPLRLSADPSSKRPVALTEEVVRIRRMREVNKEAVLLALCSKTFTSKVIIFSGTKLAAHRLKILFGLAGFKAAEIHGNCSQDQRLHALELFRKHEVDFLIATNLLSRGIDIAGVQTVINYECPTDLTSYVHRVGRTARAGREGYAVTFVTDNDRSLLKAIAKRAGSKLKSRIVAEQSITKWSQIIEQMEDQVAAILLEEREEQALRKAEMEATKAENMIAHKDEIYSRPKKTWFQTEKQKKMVVNAAKASLGREKHSGNEVISAQQAEDLKMKEKRKREREKNLPRKMRRKLEAAREMLEDENQNGRLLEPGSEKTKEKTGIPLVDLAYRRAKAVKAAQKATDAGKSLKKTSKRCNLSPQRTQSRTDEMRDLFQSDISQRRHNATSGGARRKKSKNSFKSNSRYKRR